jgi:hypothetical protein
MEIKKMENSILVNDVKAALEKQVSEITNNNYGLNSLNAVIEFMLGDDVVDQHTRGLNETNPDDYDDLMCELRDMQRCFAEKAFNDIENRVFQTEFQAVDELLNAIIENNKINEATFSDWRDADHVADVYEKELSLDESGELDRALNFLKNHEKKHGTEKANPLGLAMQDLSSNYGQDNLSAAFS